VLSFSQPAQANSETTPETNSASTIPQDPQFKDFSELLTKSPFEIEIKAEEAPKEQAPPSFYSLRGVVQLGDGWMATLINRKDPNKNIILHQGVAKDGLTLVNVNQNGDDYHKTEAIINENGRVTSVGYNTADIKKSLAKTAIPVANRPQVNNQALQQRLAQQRQQQQQQQQNKSSTPNPTPSPNAQPSTNSSNSSTPAPRRPRIRRVPTPAN